MELKITQIYIWRNGWRELNFPFLTPARFRIKLDDYIIWDVPKSPVLKELTEADIEKEVLDQIQDIAHKGNILIELSRDSCIISGGSIEFLTNPFVDDLRDFALWLYLFFQKRAPSFSINTKREFRYVWDINKLNLGGKTERQIFVSLRKMEFTNTSYNIKDDIDFITQKLEEFEKKIDSWLKTIRIKIEK